MELLILVRMFSPFFHLRRNQMVVVLYLICTILFVIACESCGPGKTGLKRRFPKKFAFPFVRGQHEPSVSEMAFKASGPPLGKIIRGSQRFKKDLVRVTNPDILFRKDHNGSLDRYMTPRCKEKLEILSIKVQNYWAGVQLQVTAAYIEHKGFLSKQSKLALHYEGRAVNIRTSDRDRTKYGTLARLAVQAGFDWVHYESKAHIHCSCRADDDTAFLRTMEGCFHASTTQVLRRNQSESHPEVVSLKDLQMGDHVLATNSDGDLVFSEVVAWLDMDFSTKTLFYKIKTESGYTLMLTPSHLIHTKHPETGDLFTQYAGNLAVGDIIYTTDPEDKDDVLHSGLVEQRVISISQRVSVGTMAPLTRHGTIVVNRISSSCYASIKDAEVAHAAFAPLRWWVDTMGHPSNTSAQQGVHPFAKFLYSIAPYILPSGFLLNDGSN